MKKQLAFFVAIIVILLYSSCGTGPDSEQTGEKAPINANSGADSFTIVEAEEMRTQDSISPILQEQQRIADSIAGVLPDNLAITPVGKTNSPKNNAGAGGGRQGQSKAIVEKTPGTLAYYCPGRMLENTSNNVSLTISKATLHQAIQELTSRVAEVVPEESVDMIETNITGKSIIIYPKMKVELKYSDKDFETLYKPENEEQIFNGTNDMYWDWIIKPIRIGTCQLAIIISAFDEKNGRWIAAQTPPKVFDIKVQVNPLTYFEKLWDFLKNNPEWLFIQILFPIIAYFFGRKQAKK